MAHGSTRSMPPRANWHLTAIDAERPLGVEPRRSLTIARMAPVRESAHLARARRIRERLALGLAALWGRRDSPDPDDPGALTRYRLGDTCGVAKTEHRSGHQVWRDLQFALDLGGSQPQQR